MFNSLSKLKLLLPGVSSPESTNKRHSTSLEPEVGFQLFLDAATDSISSTSQDNDSEKADIAASSNVPELNVHLIGARHLPSTFGFKAVQGYVIKVKLFPGSMRYDSTIQTSSWPKFNESFKFPMASQIKSSLKRYDKETRDFDSLPKKLFNGHFVVFTVYALLELPPGGFTRFKGTYRSLREKSTALLTKSKCESTENSKDSEKHDGFVQLTKSELRRNIGSVTCFLDPNIFQENHRLGKFATNELWLPVRDITATTQKLVNVNASPKGQVELTLEVCDNESSSAANEDNSVEQFNTKEALGRRQWSLTEMKRIIKTGKSAKQGKELFLKVTTSKIRCSIKVKEQFESEAGLIYVKTKILQHDILCECWKSNPFLPSLSTRLDENNSKLIVPLNEFQSLNNISIRTTLATKTKVGKKIVLGAICIGPNAEGALLEHWKNLTISRNQPITMWHNFQ